MFYGNWMRNRSSRSLQLWLITTATCMSLPQTVCCVWQTVVVRASIILFFGTFRARSVSARIYGRKSTQDPVGQFVPVAGVDDRCCKAKEVALIERMAGRA
jgi:hypothetical protein